MYGRVESKIALQGSWKEIDIILTFENTNDPFRHLSWQPHWWTIYAGGKKKEFERSSYGKTVDE